MKVRHSETTQPNHPASATKPILWGAGIGFILISFFLVSAGTADPEWGKLWMIKPLLMVPLAGASGGAFYYFMNHLYSRGRINKIIAIILSLVFYIIALWMGTVLGLNGTMWN